MQQVLQEESAQNEDNGWIFAVKRAFPYTIPVLTGYLFIGIAFGVMYAQKGYGVGWATLMSLTVYAGAGQYLATNFFVAGISLVQVLFLTLMVNIRHVFYGLSLLKPFSQMGKAKWYMAFALTDETYSLLCTTKIPAGVSPNKFLLSIAVLDHAYWIIGSIIGNVAGTLIPFDATGIDFAMTALFVVILVEQWMVPHNRAPVCIGIACALVALLIFGASSFVLPAMLCIIAVLLLGKKKLSVQMVDSAQSTQGGTAA